MDIRDVILEEERAEMARFLKKFHIVFEEDIDKTLALYEEDRLVATASAAKNIVKCVAVDPEFRSQNHLSTLMSALIKRLNEEGKHHIYVYAWPEHDEVFQNLGFKPIVQTMNISFLEQGGDIQRTLTALKKEYDLDNRPKGAVVVNANPLTKGHLHLVRKAKENHDTLLVFVVSEDRSFFPFADRFAIVQEALAADRDVVVLPTKDYLVSFATFPKYFQKREEKIREEHALIDVFTFKQHYMKIFNIVARYVGDEPYSPMTDTYNKTMRHYLGNDLRVIERKTVDEKPISASTVRTLLEKRDVSAVKPYVPEATLRYLESEKGRKILKTIKGHDQRH